MTTDTRSPVPGQRDRLGLDPTAGAILDCLDLGLLVVDRDQTILYRNAVAATILPAGDSLAAAFHGGRFLGEFAGWEAELRRVIDPGETVSFDWALPVPGSSSRVLARVRCMPLRASNSQRVTAVVIVVDQSQEREVSAEQLEVSQRLASLGRLAARVAHELNNPLDGILRYINLALRVADIPPESKLKSYLSESRTGVMRMVRIIGELLEFSRTTDGEFDELNVNEIVEQAIRNTASAAEGNRIVVSADFQTLDMPVIRSSRLYQVCCNLIRNAIDAMPAGGRLSLTTGIVGEDIVIEVADTGGGLPPEADRVFEPFFTTKAPGKGTGLGLAICKDFIEGMQGTITAAPGEEGGAVFTIRIPTSSGRRPSRLVSSPADPDGGISST